MKQKLLIIPDVHGRTFWKEALESDNYKKVIFLGDYVDPYWFEGIDNFTAIFNFKDILSQKTKDPDRIVLLLGNHDLSYYSDHFSKMGKSDRYDDENEEELKQLFHDNRKLFKLAHEETIDNTHYLFSHAGVTQEWLKQNKKIIGKPDAEHLNHLLDTNKGIGTLAQVGEARWGRYPSGSIVWADAEELADSEPFTDTYQIVGHTMQFDGPIITDQFACLDCRTAFTLDHKGKHNPVSDITPYEIIW